MFEQSQLLENIKKYLINRGRENYVARMALGYCLGFALLFCLCVVRKKLDHFEALIREISAWKEDEEELRSCHTKRQTAQWKKIDGILRQFLIENPKMNNKSLLDQLSEAKLKKLLTQEDVSFYMSASLKENTSIEKLLGYIDLLQMSESTSHVNNGFKEQDLLNMLSRSEVFSTTKVFKRACFIYKSDLADILNKIPLNHPVSCGTGNHAFVIFRSHKEFIFCDSNHGFERFLNSQEMAKKILETTYANIVSETIPFSFDILFPNNEKTVDTTQLEDIKNRPGPIKEKTPNDYPLSGLTLFFFSLMSGEKAGVKAIEAAGEDELSEPLGSGFYPIHCAIFLPNAVECITKLLQRGVSPNQTLESKDLECMDSETQNLYWGLKGATPLHIAVAANRLDVAKKLLSVGADINSRTDSGLTPLMLAVLHGHYEMVEWLCDQGADLKPRIDKVTNLKPTWSDRKLPLEFFGAVRNLQGCKEFDAALCAMKNNHFDILLMLIERGLEINRVTVSGIDLLHLAIENNNEDAVEYLINNGADPIKPYYPDASSRSLLTPLWLACKINNPNIVEMLLKAKAGDAPVHSFSKSYIEPVLEKGSIEVLELLKKYNCPLNKEFSKIDPFSAAIRNKDWRMIEYLLNGGFDIKIENINFPIFAALPLPLFSKTCAFLAKKNFNFSKYQYIPFLDDKHFLKALYCCIDEVSNKKVLTTIKNVLRNVSQGFLGEIREGCGIFDKKRLCEKLLNFLDKQSKNIALDEISQYTKIILSADTGLESLDKDVEFMKAVQVFLEDYAQYHLAKLNELSDSDEMIINDF